MVLLCKGLPQEILDFNRVMVTEAAARTPLNFLENSNPAQEATGKKTGNQMMISFTLIIHGYSYVNGVKLFVKQIDGVERVKGEYCNAIKLEVKGKVDPFKIQELVEHETKRKVELFFPSAQVRRHRDENQGTEEKLKEQKKMMHKNIIANKKTKLSMFVLKIRLCCDSCNQKLKKNLEMKGLETVTLDVERSLVTIRSAVGMTELRSYFKDELKKDVEIIFPVEVEIPSMRVNSAANKREDEAGIATKKERDNEATNKKDKCSTAAFNMKYRGDREEAKGKHDFINSEKDKNGGRETKPKVFRVNGAGEERGRGKGSGSNKKDEDRNGMRYMNAEIYYRGDNHVYDGWRDLPAVKDLDWPYELFSDENPRSCHIM